MILHSLEANPRLFFSIQVSLYSIGSVFMIIIMLKSEAVANHMLPRWYWVVSHNLTLLLCIHNFINLAKSPKPQAEMQSQTMSEPPASFINGCRHSLLHVSPNLLHTYLTMISTKSFTIRFINPSDLFLCNLEYPSLFPCFPSLRMCLW